MRHWTQERPYDSHNVHGAAQAPFKQRLWQPVSKMAAGVTDLFDHLVAADGTAIRGMAAVVTRA
jgi:hypothetical protein